MIAFVDESLRQRPDGLCVLAAVVAPNDIDEGRDAVRSVLLPGQLRFHWKDENEGQRRRMLKAIEDMGVRSLVYVCRPVSMRRQARARALCVNALVWDLWTHEVDEVVFESRENHNDAKDRQTIIQAKKAKRAAESLIYRFERPDAEPLLWLPDAVAGAVSAAEAQEHRYLDLLRERITTRRIAP